MIRSSSNKWLLFLMLPLACAWIEKQERLILAEGVPLDPKQFADARALGITEPERVRLLTVIHVPLPGSRIMRAVGLLSGTLSTGTVGMAARYGIFLREPHQTDRLLLAHELMHIRQYEKLGGIRPFLQRYLLECLTVGYSQADMEWEAIEAASTLCG